MKSPSKPPTLHELLEQFTTTMLITYTGDNGLHARPMAILEVDPGCRMWLITSRDSAKVHEIEDCTAVHLCMQNDGEVYLSIEGEASIVRDSTRIAELWHDGLLAWFPKGPEDPDIALIVVTPKDAEYWDHRASNQFGSVRPEGDYLHGTKPESR